MPSHSAPSSPPEPFLVPGGVSFSVVGRPAPQGSKRAVRPGVMVEMSRYVKPWRRDVEAAGKAAVGMEWTPLDGALLLDVTFVQLRPKSAPKDRVHPTVAPDLSKLVRSTEDALTTAGIIRDDARITDLHAYKRYDDWSGAIITIREVTT